MEHICRVKTRASREMQVYALVEEDRWGYQAGEGFEWMNGFIKCLSDKR